MQERANNLFEKNQATSFKIRDSRDTLICRIDADDTEELKELFNEQFDLLDNGTYRIICGTTPNFKETTSPTTTVKKGQATPRTQTTFNPMNFDIEKIKKEAYEQGVKDAQIEILQRRVKDLEDKVQQIIRVISDKFDELDGQNDNDLMSKIGKMAETFGSAKDAMEGFKM
jgi:hypothetical protein